MKSFERFELSEIESHRLKKRKALIERAAKRVDEAAKDEAPTPPKKQSGEVLW